MRWRSIGGGLVLMCCGVLMACQSADGETGTKASPAGSASYVKLSSPPDTSSPPLPPSASPSPLPSSYRFRLSTICDGHIGTGRGVYDVLVKDSTVSRATQLPGAPERVPPLDDYPTLADLAELAEQADVPAGQLKLTLDDNGVLTSLEIDYILLAVDDEQCFYVSNFKA